MPISITNRAEKGSPLTNAEIDAIFEALAAAIGLVVSSSQPSDGTCPLWLDTTDSAAPVLKAWDGAAWNEVSGSGGMQGTAFV